ncbi:MAG: hypothetical protein IPK68_23295 [Bdellovibrionales bacterium]|nr:hypothetical protein [Bdellovibrionales bacterium]
MSYPNRHRWVICFFLLFLGTLNTFAATVEVLEEAEGLAEETPEVAAAEVPHDQTSSALNQQRTRTYVLIDGSQSTGSSDDQIYFPNAQLSFSGTFNSRRKVFSRRCGRQL